MLISDARQFITAKQHENISLHSLVQGIAINDIAWLAIPGASRPNPQEATKRRKLVEDLIIWIFEGYLIISQEMEGAYVEVEVRGSMYHLADALGGRIIVFVLQDSSLPDCSQRHTQSV